MNDDPDNMPADAPDATACEQPAEELHRDLAMEGRDLAFTYPDGTQALRGVSVEGRAGRLVCLLGPNGSGKTTLLRCLMGRLHAQRGQVLLDGDPLKLYSARDRARRLAYVPQQPDVAFAMNVQEIILTGRLVHTGMLGLAGRKDVDVAREAMRMTDTLTFAARRLDELSGGEAQRVMIARALAQQPNVCLLDEPTSHLDIRHQLRIYELMQRVAHDWPMAVICISHDVNLAARFADELILMRDGQVVAAGPPTQAATRDILAEVYDVEIDLIDTGEAVPTIRAR
ncbi:MAG: ATP-binding cassette domain-containing protein [Planctomycetes bacterium]|jgi:iron complex transport system ATP-binding protein|nr:ATP-binding cassette domain-containing protein [Planctomycetota bacterium]